MTDTIKTNEATMEPAKYFKVLKSGLKKTKKKKLDSQLQTIATNIIKAKKLGQKAFLHRLSFTYQTIKKEQELLALGFNKYMLRQDVLEFIDKVTPKDSVKIIEWERYQRAVPADVMEKLEKVQALNIFDGYCVVFTDFTDNKYQTKADKQVIERNRDPVLFGYFEHKGTGLIHDRLYLIADWIDEHCELDFSAMVEKMSAMGIKRPEREIATDVDYLNDIVAGTLDEMNKAGARFGTSMEIPYANVQGKNKKTMLQKAMFWRK